MPGRNVSVWPTNWTNIGQTRRVDRWSVDIIVQWTNEAGVPQEHSGTYYFPDELATIPLSRLREYMQEIILKEARIQLGIDEA